MVKDTLSPKQVARAIGVSESSLKRWCDRGLIPTIRTAGGHRRLSIGGVLRYLRETGQTLVEPEHLGLPATATKGARGLERGRSQLTDALKAGDETLCRQIVFDLYLAGNSLAIIGDDVIATSLAAIGEEWDCGDVEVYQERRGCGILTSILHELRAAQSSGGKGPAAVGGTLEGDPYSLPTAMVEVVLREHGWRACSLGASLPAETLIAAIEEIRPALFWLSASYVADEERFFHGFKEIHATTSKLGVPLVVGGQALVDDVRRRIQYTAFCDSLQHLEGFIEALPPVTPSERPRAADSGA